MQGRSVQSTKSERSRDIQVTADGFVFAKGRRYHCALGRAGVITEKREGDGATPAGRLPIREVLYREDQIAAPQCAVAIRKIERRTGWCDDPGCPAYNSLVSIPHDGSYEELWRLDHLYDLIVVLGYNDRPAVPGLGSAIFMHVARPNYSPTAGCIALKRDDLIEVLEGLDIDSGVAIGDAPLENDKGLRVLDP